MRDDLPQRANMLFDRIKSFPEAGHTEQGVIMKRDAFVAFLDLRQLLEREILPALEELARKER